MVHGICSNKVNLLRIFSCLWVLFFHAQIHYRYVTGIACIDTLIGVGAIGCTIFFILSGFSLRLGYKENMTSAQELFLFYRKRLRKIYPIFLFMLIVCLIFRYRIPVNKIKLLPIELTLTQTLFDKDINAYYYNDNWWFLSCLWILYLIYPFLNMIINTINKSKKKLLILASYAFSVFAFFYYYDKPMLFLDYYTNPIYRVPEFLVGMLMADFMNNRMEKKNYYDTSVNRGGWWHSRLPF